MTTTTLQQFESLTQESLSKAASNSMRNNERLNQNQVNECHRQDMIVDFDAIGWYERKKLIRSIMLDN